MSCVRSERTSFALDVLSHGALCSVFDNLHAPIEALSGLTADPCRPIPPALVSKRPKRASSGIASGAGLVARPPALWTKVLFAWARKCLPSDRMRTLGETKHSLMTPLTKTHRQGNSQEFGGSDKAASRVC